MSKKSSVMMFALGGVVGFLMAKRYFTDDNRRKRPTETEECRSDDESPFDHQYVLAKADQAKHKKDISSYVNYARDLGYGKANTDKSEPFIIPPEDFGINDDYEQISLTYYADSVLADDNERAMTAEEIEDSVGTDALNHFGEYENDSVFVRNDKLKCDFEILLDERTYSDVAREKPHILQEE